MERSSLKVFRRSPQVRAPSLSTPRSEHRVNILGRPIGPGILEGILSARFEPAERSLAAKALRDLEDDGPVRAT